MKNDLLAQIGIRLPIIQAPMAGISTPKMAAAVSNAGGLGSIGIGNLSTAAAQMMIAQVRSATSGPFNVNVFCHRPAIANHAVESDWLARLTPEFTRFGVNPPDRLREIYLSFVDDRATQEMLISERPPVVSFHFGLPSREVIDSLKNAGVILLATATNLHEAKLIDEAGIDAIVAQGYEAGGHRGMFEPDERDDALGTMALTRLIASSMNRPVIAAGGIMDGAGIAAALALGATAAQLGTAFLLCPESSADAGYRATLTSEAALHTTMTRAISGRPARSLPNRLTTIGDTTRNAEIPDYPIAYDAAKSLHAIAARSGEFGYGAQWAGQGAALTRSLTAADLMATLEREWRNASR